MVSQQKHAPKTRSACMTYLDQHTDEPLLLQQYMD